jgi:hypothetical protein
VIQVVELDWVRALSLDGRNWAIRYAHDEDEETRSGPLHYDPRVNLSLMMSIDGEQYKTRVIRRSLSPDRVRINSQQLFDVLSTVKVPFEAADRYEYWLLDSGDESPIALLHSCIDEEEMKRAPPPPAWLPMPAAELSVPDPNIEEEGVYQPPINYRLQQFIEARAGSKPRAAWFERSDQATENFPPCLIRDDWEDPEGQRLSDLYLQRLAPRLLMMDGLPRTVRRRLEQAARDYVFEVEMFYPLYPDVVDSSLLNTARAEARLRHANEV